jgi:hypothetical protein
MTRHSIGRILVAALTLAAVFLPAAAHAQAIVKVNDTVFFRIGLQLQAWADWNQDPVTSGYAQNLYLRRARFQLSGQMAPGVTFFFQTDNPNLGKAPKALGAGFILQDAWLEWKLNDAFALGGGLFLIPLSRNGLQSTNSFMTFDISPTSTVFSGPTTSSNLRDTGFYLKGYLIDGGRLEYRAAATQGIRLTGARNAFRTSGWLQYNFAELERGYVYVGTNLGKKKIVNISGGYDTQNTYKAYSGDFFANLPVGAGNELAGQAQWVHYDGGTFLPAIPRQNDYLGELAFYIAAAKFQPFVAYEDRKHTDTFNKSKNIKWYTAGANYYISGQNMKLSGRWYRIEPNNGVKKTNEFTIQIQAFYN